VERIGEPAQVVDKAGHDQIGPLRRPVVGVSQGPGFVTREVGADTGDAQREPQRQLGRERRHRAQFQGEVFLRRDWHARVQGDPSGGGRREGRPTMAAHASIVASPARRCR